MITHEGADNLYVGSTALDDVAGSMGGVPLEIQPQDMAVQVIPYLFYEAFRAFGQVDAHTVDTHAPRRRSQHHRTRRDPQGLKRVGPELLQGQQAQDQGIDDLGQAISDIMEGGAQ